MASRFTSRTSQIPTQHDRQSRYGLERVAPSLPEVCCDEPTDAARGLPDDAVTGISRQPLPNRMHRFIIDNLHRGVTLKDLARFTGYSEKYCSELFLAQMGESFTMYVKRLRLERATVLLHSSERLADIAARLGFQDQYAFSHFFKKATGFSPRAFRQGAHHHGFQPASSALAFHGRDLPDRAKRR